MFFSEEFGIFYSEYGRSLVIKNREQHSIALHGMAYSQERNTPGVEDRDEQPLIGRLERNI